MLEGVGSSDTSVHLYQTTPFHIPKDSNIRIRSREYPKSQHIKIFSLLTYAPDTEIF